MRRRRGEAGRRRRTTGSFDVKCRDRPLRDDAREGSNVRRESRPLQQILHAAHFTRHAAAAVCGLRLERNDANRLDGRWIRVY